MATPLPLLGKAGSLLPHLSLSLHQLIPNLPVAGMGLRCLITLQPAMHKELVCAMCSFQ